MLVLSDNQAQMAKGGGEKKRKNHGRIELMTSHTTRKWHHTPLHHTDMFGLQSGLMSSILFGQAIRHGVTFWPKMFRLHQAQGQNLPKICLAHHQGPSPIIRGPIREPNSKFQHSWEEMRYNHEDMLCVLMNICIAHPLSMQWVARSLTKNGRPMTISCFMHQPINPQSQTPLLLGALSQSNG
jgi:hypothetical protein